MRSDIPANGMTGIALTVAVVDNVLTFKTAHAAALGKTTANVTIDDKTAVNAALTDYSNLTDAVKALLTTEKTLLDDLAIKIGQLEAAAAFRTTHTAALALTVAGITEANVATNKPLVEAALTVYSGLTDAVKALLTSENTLLTNLKAKIDTFGTATESSIDIRFWVNESDDTILSSLATTTVYKTNTGGRPASFSASLGDGYTITKWLVDGTQKGTDASITINATDYYVGTHRLGVQVTKGGKSYSTEITFTVTN